MFFLRVLLLTSFLTGSYGQTSTTTFTNTYPQNYFVATYCPSGYTFQSYICAGGVYGPYYTNDYLESAGQCSCCCDCNSVTVTCAYNSVPSMQPIYTPTLMPIYSPTVMPIYSPTVLPIYSPTVLPIYSPTAKPTPDPSVQPIHIPTVVPTYSPTYIPSLYPTYTPTFRPSYKPTTIPTPRPSELPTLSPSTEPSFTPSLLPTAQPSYLPTCAPSITPSYLPSFNPTFLPSSQPSRQPSKPPSVCPTYQPMHPPTSQPSRHPIRIPSCLPSKQPVVRPSGQPSAQPICVPFAQPTKQPSKQPILKPSLQPSPQPGGKPSKQPSSYPSSRPSRFPSLQPSTNPSVQPSSLPSTLPSAHPSRLPSKQPFQCPSQQPFRQPSLQPLMNPSNQPTFQPSLEPSKQPSTQPLRKPSSRPSNQPSLRPSRQPTSPPSVQPSSEPSKEPSTQPSRVPSVEPTRMPTSTPSLVPSVQPYHHPSMQPFYQPTELPSNQPTTQPTFKPTTYPTTQPTNSPSSKPSHHPTEVPSIQPSAQPSRRPSKTPSGQPRRHPSSHPSSQPSFQPHNIPSSKPSNQPSSKPSSQPFRKPSFQPLRIPTSQPHTQPSIQPSTIPTFQPSISPSSRPSVAPSQHPSIQPSQQPSRRPSRAPSNEPSTQPSTAPSLQPSSQPRMNPSSQPSSQPSLQPIMQPSWQPSRQPTSLPSLQPSMKPSCQPSTQPTLQPIRRPSIQPSSQPSKQPLKQPSKEPSCEPTAVPSRQPSATPTSLPSLRPSSQPTFQPSSTPSIQPSYRPTTQPSYKPSGQPSKVPSPQPTAVPSFQPSIDPSTQPIRRPSLQPSTIPSRIPSIQPSKEPSCPPTVVPSRQPSATPTSLPSLRPSSQPTLQPSSTPSIQPSYQPSMQPSYKPSGQPSKAPSRQPTAVPSFQPSVYPSTQPIRRPSLQPSTIPFRIPSIQPSKEPSCPPTVLPSRQPSATPTSLPSLWPSIQPIFQPSSTPSIQPLYQPSMQPSYKPSGQPRKAPSRQPTAVPSFQPSVYPSTQPIRRPSLQPSNGPSHQPSVQPSYQPTQYPTQRPSRQPSIKPSTSPSLQPSTQPVAHPSSQPTIQPSWKPSIQPFAEPSHQPREVPSEQPSALPSSRPSFQPFNQPTVYPSSQPSMQPSSSPSIQPSVRPTFHPTDIPSKQPSAQPLEQPSSQPSYQPACRPLSMPSIQPWTQPTTQPSSQPSCKPTLAPSTQPFSQPSLQPLSLPSEQPNSPPSSQPLIVPTRQPSDQPSIYPSTQPSLQPSQQPSAEPSIQPSGQPWAIPSIQPFSSPTKQPLSLPSSIPLSLPTIQPSSAPSSLPSLQPHKQPSDIPSILPSHRPSCQPTYRPSRYPSIQPWCSPSSHPSQEPSLQSSLAPSVQPLLQPSSEPTRFPSCQPQSHPSLQPISMPTFNPSLIPTKRPSVQPSVEPSSNPSIQPAFQPTWRPSKQPAGCVPSQQPIREPSCRPKLTPTVYPTDCPSFQPLEMPSSKPSSQPFLDTPTIQPWRKPSKQPTSQPWKQPRRKPSTQPSKAPSRQPLRRPNRRPTDQPSRSPTYTPSIAPSAQPNIRPSAQPYREPTSSPTAKSKKPINARVPTFLTTISPTKSFLQELNSRVQSVIRNLTSASISSNEKYSVYQQLKMNGVSQHAHCNGWAAFIQTDLVIMQNTYLPLSLSFVSIAQKNRLSSDFSHTYYVCEDSSVVKYLVNSIAGSSESLGFGKMTTRNCSGNTWTVYTCSSDMTMPLSLCVNCVNPCSPLTSISDISSCSGNITAATNGDQQLSFAQILSVGFVGLFKPPEITMVNITSTRSSITVSAMMSSAGELACAVFLSTAAAPTSYDQIEVQNYLSFSSSRNESILIMTGLRAITQYKIYCFTSSYGVRTTLSTVVEKYFLTSTKCCKYLSVSQSSTTLLEGVNSLNFLSMTLSAYPTSSIAVQIALMQLKNGTATFSTSANLIPSRFEIDGSSSLSPLQLVASLSKLSVGSYSYSIQIGGSSANEYEVVFSSGRNPVFSVTAADSIQPAPSLSQAVFSDDGSSFTMLFDSATNRGSTTTSFNCAQLFEFACAKQSQCQWHDDRHVISFVYGSSSCASPGALVRLSAEASIKAPCLAIGGKCPSYSMWPNTTRSAVPIGSPIAGIAPQIVVSVPAVVGSCDSLTIDISSSTGSGGRPWIVAMIQVRRSDNGNISLLQAYLNSTFKASPPTFVPSTLIERGFSYIFSVYLCNFLSMCNQASQVVVAVESVIPIVYLPGQPIRTTRRNSLVTIASAASVSLCSGDNSKSISLQYSWAISQNGIPLLSMSSISNDPSKLILSPYTLTANTYYTVQVTVTIKGSLKTAAASCVLFVSVGKVVSVVSGGQSRNVKVQSSMRIDASNSYDEDVKGLTGTAAGLFFDWNCVQIAPILNNSCLSTLAWSSGGTSTSAVTFTSLVSSAGTQSVITIVVQDSSGKRKSTSTVTITVVPVNAPIVSSSSNALNGVMNPSQSLQLFGSVIYPDISPRSIPVVCWSVSDRSLNLTAVSITPVSAVLKAVSNNVYLVIPPSTLLAGSVLTFTLSCCGDESLPSYSSSVTVTVNAPPRAGFFQLYPNPGIELQDNFLFSAGQWTDSDLPMQYQFGYISPQGATVTTLSKSLKAFGNSLLPAGPDSANNILSTFVVVFDVLNANSSLPYSVVVQRASQQTSALEMISKVVGSSGNLSTASVDEVKQFNGIVTYLLGIVNCSLAPNCSALHRRECSPTPHTCGSCMSDIYVGETGDSNSMCVLISSLISASSVQTKCATDFQCSGLQRCLKGTCVVPQKSCISNCSGHGECMFVNSNMGVAVRGCTIDDPSCVAQCICEPAYVESLYCAWNVSEMRARQTMKSQVFTNIERLTSVEYPDADSLSGWIATLASASNQIDELSDGSVDSVLSVSSVVLQSAQGIGLGNGALLGLASSLSSAIDFVQKTDGLRHRRLLARNLSSAVNTASSLEAILGHLGQFGLTLAGNMLPGQDAVESMQSTFRLSATVVPSYEAGSKAMAVGVPQSTLEVATRQTQATVSVPCDASTTADDFLHVTSISLPSSFSGDSLQANPLIVYLSRLPCFSSRTGCEIEFTLPNTNPRPDLLRNVSAANETASAHCLAGVRSEFNYTCSSGYVLNFTCSGDFAGVIRRRCPSVKYNSSCTLLNSGLIAEGGAQCRAVAQSEFSTTCQCPLLASSTPIPGNLARRRLQEVSNNGSLQGVHSISVSSLLVTITGGVESTILSATELNVNVIQKGVTVLVTMLVLAVSIILFIGTSKYLDYKEEMKGKELFTDGESASVKTVSESMVNCHSYRQKRLGRTVGNQELAMLEESLPSIFSSQSFVVKFKNEVQRNHKWFGVIFHHSKVYPRVLRAMALSTNIILMLFVQSMTYNLTNPDDGFCEMLESQEDCQQPKSSFGTGGNKCLWTDSSCHFIQPSTDLTVILFVACFSALVTTPISLALNWLIFRVLAAPTSTISKQQVIPDQPIVKESRKIENDVANVTGHDYGQSSRGRAATEEFEQLRKGLHSYRALLSAKQRDEFDKLWGLSTDGTFLRSNHNGLLQASKGKDVAEVLLSELEMVSKSVEKERNRLDKMTLRKERQRRLLYLFQYDLLPGVSGQILHSKVHREDLQVHGAASFKAKMLVYLLIVSCNAAMLFYVFLFALGQTKYRQDAWFRSFMIWISMEIFVVGTVMVLITHVVLPSLIMPDVAKIKDKLVDSIREYQRDLKNKLVEEKADAGEKTFNSAEFFFASSKLAKFYVDLPVAQIISKFSTPWPRQSYQHVVDVSRRYDQRFSGLSSSVGIILFFFIGNFLIAPPGVQDGMLHSLFTVAVGYLVLLHIQLYNVQPALAFIPLFTICVLVHFIVLSCRRKSQSKIADVAPIMEDRNNFSSNNQSTKNHLSRRDSILAGLNAAAAAQNHLVEYEHSSGSDPISIGSISMDSADIEILSDTSEKQFNLAQYIKQLNERAEEDNLDVYDSNEMDDSQITDYCPSMEDSEDVDYGDISNDQDNGLD